MHKRIARCSISVIGCFALAAALAVLATLGSVLAKASWGMVGSAPVRVIFDDEVLVLDNGGNIVGGDNVQSDVGDGQLNSV